MNATPVATASKYESLNEVDWNIMIPYESLNEVDWNIMIPADVRTTRNCRVFAN
jgi:hypothetical protein